MRGGRFIELRKKKQGGGKWGERKECLGLMTLGRGKQKEVIHRQYRIMKKGGKTRKAE